MRQVYINNNRIVCEIIPEFDPVFPGIPITERYSKEFLSRCLEIPDEVVVEQGMEYIPLKNIFTNRLTYSGPIDILSEAEPVVLDIKFSELGEWDIVDGSIENVQKINDTIYIPGNSSGPIQIHFVDIYDRTMDITINVRIEESISEE